MCLPSLHSTIQLCGVTTRRGKRERKEDNGGTTRRRENARTTKGTTHALIDAGERSEQRVGLLPNDAATRLGYVRRDYHVHPGLLPRLARDLGVRKQHLGAKTHRYPAVHQKQ